MKTGFLKILVLGISVLGISILSCQLASGAPFITATPRPTATATLSPLQARAGLWQGTTSFGSFKFEVSPDGTEIVNPTLHYESEGGFLKGDITMTDPTRFPILEDNSFELDIPNAFTFKVQFSKDGTSASGYWEMKDPIKAKENWKIKDHEPGIVQAEPVSTQIVPTEPPAQASSEGESQASSLEEIAGVWLETYSGGSAHLEIQADGDTVFTIVSGSNQGYQDRGKYWFENGELNVQAESGGDIGKYIVYVTRQEGEVVSLRYETIDDPFDARREAMTYAPLTLIKTESQAGEESTSLPLDIRGCSPARECPEAAVAILSFFEEDEELLPGVEYPVSVPMDTQVRFSTGWCTLTQELLDDNLEHIEFAFLVDGVSYIDQLSTNTFTEPDSSDSTKLNYCYTVGGVVSGWQENQEYQIVFGMKFKEAIFDGWDTYEQGDYTRIYLITAAP